MLQINSRAETEAEASGSVQNGHGQTERGREGIGEERGERGSQEVKGTKGADNQNV